jgi:hypothetical protein
LAWTKSQDNRLFNKTGSRFYVGEKFTASELDSFQTNGFEIIGVKTERGNLSNHPAVTWLTHEELRKKLILKED